MNHPTFQVGAGWLCACKGTLLAPFWAASCPLGHWGVWRQAVELQEEEALQHLRCSSWDTHVTHLSFGELMCISLACPLKAVNFLVKGCSYCPLQNTSQLYWGLSPPASSTSAESRAPKHVLLPAAGRHLAAGAGSLWAGVKGGGKPFSGGQAAPLLL